MKKVSKLDEYLFDLNGYLIIENALSNKELKEIIIDITMENFTLNK